MQIPLHFRRWSLQSLPPRRYAIPASGNTEDRQAETVLPPLTPRCTFGAAAALADAVATVCSCPFSSARMHVMIFVVLAIAIGSVSRFSEQHTAGIAYPSGMPPLQTADSARSPALSQSRTHFPKTEAGFPRKKPVLFLLFLFKIQIPLVFFLFKNGKPDALLGPAFCLLLLHYMRFPVKSW